MPAPEPCKNDLLVLHWFHLETDFLLSKFYSSESRGLCPQPYWDRIPILDGGLIAMLLVESVMRRDINEGIKVRLYQAAFVCLVLFAGMVIFNDVVKMLPSQYKFCLLWEIACQAHQSSA